MTDSEVEKRMRVLSAPIERQIMMCDSREEIMMLASVLLTRAVHMFDSTIEEDGRKQMMKSYT
jgi:hypothetical protein